MSHDNLQSWVATRPPSVQSLAAEFPLGTQVLNEDGNLLYLLGYTESDQLILSKIDPSEDYDGAVANKIYACANHFRKLST